MFKMFGIRRLYSVNSALFTGNALKFSTTGTNRIKEIVETKEGKKLIFNGIIKEPDADRPVLKSALESKTTCPICSTNLDVKHTDVLILSQFVRSDGCMLPRRVTGLCKTQQKRISYMVAMAQKAGLMSNLTPANSKKDPKKRKDYKKFNTYFDESTIPLPKEYKKKTPNLFRLI
ncbi:39S ribosomal protein S18a, mitochondrial [Cimex lectularius]|uniref:Large ribosomal subunit protein mL66 n=1 Tax=Cimex lectularius TaxID=79782 RepID=A0A8I6SDC0_CIMLE|nr:39S ribosomal protein S18a, mitochondrial [Cimex lectularius]